MSSTNEMLVACKLGVKQVVDAMEQSCCGNDGIRCPSWRSLGPWPNEGITTIREEVDQLDTSTRMDALLAQTAMVWDLAVIRGVATVWFLRRHRPLTTLFLQICQAASVPYRRLLAGQIEEPDFPVLTSAVGNLAAAPLRLCIGTEPASFRDSLSILMYEGSSPHVVCDWALELTEVKAASHASRQARVSFSWLTT